MNKTVLFILFTIFLMAGLSTAYFLLSNREGDSPEALVQIGHEYLDEKEYFKAYNYYYSAILKGEVDPEVYWLSTRLAVKLERYAEAQKYGEKAWRKGVKNKELLKLLIIMDPKDKEQKYSRAKKMFAELPEMGQENEFFKGNLFHYFDDSQNALKVWLPLFKTSPSPILGSAILKTLTDQNSIAQAIDSGKRFAAQVFLDEEGYIALADLYAYEGQLVEQIQIYENSKSKGFYGGMGLAFRSGKAAFGQGHFAAAKAHFDMIPLEPFFILDDILSLDRLAEVLVERKRPVDQQLFKKLSKASQKFLETTHQFPLPDVWGVRELLYDLNSLMLDENLFDADLSGTSVSPVAKNRKLIHLEYPDIFQPIDNNPIWKEMRLYQIYLSYLRGNVQDSEALNLSDAAASSSFEEGVQAWIQALSFEQKNELEKSMEKLNVALALIPKHPLLQLHQAIVWLRMEEFEKASGVFQTIALNDFIFALSPILNVNWAKAEIYLGDDQMAMRILSNLHKKGAFSEASMKLYRNLTAKHEVFENSETTQKFIDQHLRQSPDDWGMGILQYSKGNYEEAEKIFEKLSQSNPEYDQYELARLSTWLSQGKFDSVIQGTSQSKISSTYLLALRAMAFAGKGEKENAIKTYDQFLSTKFDNNIHMRYVDYLISEREYEKAEKTISLDAQWEDSDELLTQMSEVYLNTNRPEPGLELLKKAVGMNTQLPKAYFLLAQLHLQRGEPDLASGVCENVVGLFSENKQIRFVFGLSEFYLQRWKSAEQHLKACEEEYAEEPDWLWAYFQTLLEMSNYDEALSLYEKMKKVMPEEDYLKRELVLLYALKGDFETALGLFDSLEENSVENALVKSRVSRMAGKHERAIAFIEKHKTDERALFYWVSLMLESGNKIEFPQELRERSFSREAWLSLGAQAENSNHFDFASKIYETALLEYKDDAILWNNYAWSAHKSQAFKNKALPAIEQALQLNENDMHIIDTYAFILLDYKKFQKCQEFLENKPNFTIASPRLLYALGKCYEENILNQMAKEKYEESIKYSKGKEWELPVSEQKLLEKIDQL